MSKPSAKEQDLFSRVAEFKTLYAPLVADAVAGMDAAHVTMDDILRREPSKTKPARPAGEVLQWFFDEVDAVHPKLKKEVGINIITWDKADLWGYQAASEFPSALVKMRIIIEKAFTEGRGDNLTNQERVIVKGYAALQMLTEEWREDNYYKSLLEAVDEYRNRLNTHASEVAEEDREMLQKEFNKKFDDMKQTFQETVEKNRSALKAQRTK